MSEITYKFEPKVILEVNGLTYTTYPGEKLLSEIMELMTEELSEPYPIFTYRYFLNMYPDCCLMVYYSKSDFFNLI